MKQDKFLVVGTGRCGTAWLADVLNRCGIKTGHESVYSTSFLGWNDWQGDVTLAGMPYAKNHRSVHLVRDPLKVVNSFLASQFFAEDCECHPEEPGAHLATPYCWYFMRWVPAIYRASDELGRTIRYVVLWSQMAESLPCFNLESLVTDVRIMRDLLQVIGFGELREIPFDGLEPINSHAKGKQIVTWDQVKNHPDGEMLIDHARRYGYA